MEFLQQPAVIGILTFLGVCVALLILLAVLLNQMRGKKAAQNKAAQGATTAMAATPGSQPLYQDFEDEPLMNTPDYHDDDDPLAELYQARMEADDEEAVDLASLLSGMGEEPVHKVAEGQVNVRLQSGATAKAREMLSILRDESDGRLMVLVGDKAYRTLLDDPDIKSKFTSLMKELSTIILKPDTRVAEGTPQVEPQTVSSPSQEEATAMIAPVDAASEPEDSVEAAETSDEKAKPAEREPLPGDLPSLKVPDNPDNYKVDRFGRVSVKKIDKAPEINIADAIEAYLQYKIEQTPQFQQRGIHIRAAFGGGVRIEADGKSYEFVDQVADTEVRTFIQTAINEWQERH